MKHVPLVSWSWDEGRIWDNWMLIHFLSGVCGGLSNMWFGLSAPVLYLIAISTMLLWEVAEYAKGIRERAENRAVDVLFGLAGVYVARLLTPFVPPRAAVAAFVTSLALLAVGCVLGWRAYRRRVAAEGSQQTEAT